MAEWILLLSQQLLKLSVQRLLQHIPEDAHATRQLYCQLCSGPFHAKSSICPAFVQQMLLLLLMIFNCLTIPH